MSGEIFNLEDNTLNTLIDSEVKTIPVTEEAIIDYINKEFNSTDKTILKIAKLWDGCYRLNYWGKQQRIEKGVICQRDIIEDNIIVKSVVITIECTVDGFLTQDVTRK